MSPERQDPLVSTPEEMGEWFDAARRLGITDFSLDSSDRIAAEVRRHRQTKASPFWETARNHLENHQPRLLKELQSQGAAEVERHIASVVDEAENLQARLIGQRATPQQAEEIVREQVLTPMTEADQRDETRRLESLEVPSEAEQVSSFARWIAQWAATHGESDDEA
ncbi:MAG: hypothetical protein JSS66_09205 [Armatimonadetes bacterium]|nr:hypothetical protein [Armatimonadota bacterium]